MRENDQLDLLIDAALATYSEPPAGLEDRVLQALAAQREAGEAISHHAPLRRRWLPWAIAVPVAACALLALFIQLREPHHEAQARNPSLSKPLPDIPNSAIATNGKTPALTRTMRSHSRRMVSHPATAESLTASLPKLDVFPAPQPLTPQEQALVVYTSRASASKIQALIKAQNEPEQPLNISALRILPLEPPDEGNK